MKILRPTVKRDLSLFSIEAWERGYTQILKKSLGYSFDIIFYYDGKKVNFFHTLEDFSYFKKVVTEKLLNDANLFTRLNEEFKKNVAELEIILSLHTIAAAHLHRIHSLMGSIMSLYIFIVSDDFISRNKTAWESRKLSEGILYRADEMVEKFIEQKLLEKKLPKRLAHFITIDEFNSILNDQSDAEKIYTLLQRQKGYSVFAHTISPESSFSQFCAAHNFINPEMSENYSNNVLKGTCAFPGKAKGAAKIIITKEDLYKIKKGDIIIAVMTNTLLTPYIPLVSAIITEEGGITCHAAIIAREYQIPCIMGVSSATAHIKDGDIIELDAEKEKAQIL